MPVDIAPAVTPVYEPTISLPLDGEQANAASLQTFALALANRIEFLRQVNLTDPWQVVEYREDFSRAVLASEVLTADRTWSLLQSPAVLTVAAAPGAADEHGILRLQNVSGSATSGLLVASNNQHPGTFSQLQLMGCKIKTDSIAAGHGLEFGMFGDFTLGLGSNPAITNLGWVWNPASSPKWRLKSSQSGATTFIDTGIPVAAATWYTLRLEQQSPGVFVGRLDAGADQTVIANIPSASAVGTTQLRWIQPNSGTREYQVDYIYSRFGLAGRIV